MTRGVWRRRTGRFLGGVLMMVVTGCGGGSTPPADEVPELANQLTRVDDALADRRYPQARIRLNDLVKTTVAARDAGDLDPAQADRVLAAAAHLTSALTRHEVLRWKEDWKKEQSELAKKLEEKRKRLKEARRRLEQARTNDASGGGYGYGYSSEDGSDEDEDD